MLVPLFGLQMLVVVYRPTNSRAYDIFAAFVTNSQVSQSHEWNCIILKIKLPCHTLPLLKLQGFLVAVILCLCNGEVRDFFKLG